MKGEMNNFIKVWLSILTSLSYCYVVCKIVSKGLKRLVLFIPIVCLFLSIPLKLSSINFCGGTAFFISWLGSFKLLLLAFGKGPLALDPPISLGRFLLISCLPIEVRPNRPIGRNRPHYLAIKVLTLVILFPLFDYKEHFHPKVKLVLLCLLIYLFLEVSLAVTAATAQALLGIELEPHFNEPYLATSLQDFWGKRWNLVVSHTLRPTVYEPGIYLWAGLVGRKWAPIPATVGTFVISGLCHELIFYYLGRVRPTWEVTWFFVLHGFCLAVEIMVKKKMAREWRIPRAVSGPFTIAFVILSCSWLFFPQFLRCEADVRLIGEYVVLIDTLKTSWGEIFPIM